MTIVITGGAGFIGTKLANALLARGTVADPQGKEIRIDRIILFDVVGNDHVAPDPRIEVRTGDIGDRSVVESVIGEDTSLIFHLAAIVSANAEEDFDLGYHVNLQGTLNVLETCRAQRVRPRVVYTSSCACYGGEVPAEVPDTWHLTPQTSYGVQKAMGDLLLMDYRRKGFVDGRGVRLPTIVVRPGKPNKAASTFASSIVREPLAGKEVVCPVSPEARMYILSPRKAVTALLRAAELPAESFGNVPTLVLPGLDVSIGELVAALGRAAGEKAVKLIQWKQDDMISRIVAGWPGRFSASRARALGFQDDGNVDEIVKAYIEDEVR